jgi:hypothetical protein
MSLLSLATHSGGKDPHAGRPAGTVSAARTPDQRGVRAGQVAVPGTRICSGGGQGVCGEDSVQVRDRDQVAAAEVPDLAFHPALLIPLPRLAIRRLEPEMRPEGGPPRVFHPGPAVQQHLADRRGQLKQLELVPATSGGGAAGRAASRRGGGQGDSAQAEAAQARGDTAAELARVRAVAEHEHAEILGRLDDAATRERAPCSAWTSWPAHTPPRAASCGPTPRGNSTSSARHSPRTLRRIRLPSGPYPSEMTPCQLPEHRLCSSGSQQGALWS